MRRKIRGFPPRSAPVCTLGAPPPGEAFSARSRTPEGTKKRRRNGVSFLYESNFFLDLGSLAETVAQVVELRSANLAVTDGFHVDDVGCMHRENLLAADTV